MGEDTTARERQAIRHVNRCFGSEGGYRPPDEDTMTAIVRGTLEYADMNSTDIKVLASALCKFAPDLAAELVRRCNEANGAMNAFVALMSKDEQEGQHG